MSYGKNIAVLTLIGVAFTLVGCGAAAHASSGAPDPGFGSDGIVELPRRASTASDSTPGRAIVLPDGGVVVPEFRDEYRVRGGEQVAVTRSSLRFVWLRPDGGRDHAAAPFTLPTNLYGPRVVRTASGHLLVIGVRLRADDRPASLFVLRVSAAGTPEAAPGGASAQVTVPLTSIPHLGPNPGMTEVEHVSVTPNGRVFISLRQRIVRGTKEPEWAGYGPVVVAAIDPSVGLASSFANGGLILEPATDTRSSTTVATTTDEAGRLLALVRSVRNGIGGTTQRTRVSRYDTSGTVDTTFAGGQVTIGIDSIDTAYAGTPSIAVLRNGDVLLRARKTTVSGERAVTSVELRRLDSSGQPISTFGTSGVAEVVLQRSTSDDEDSPYGYGSEDGGEDPAPLLEQPDGKLLVAVERVHSANGTASRRFGVMRTTSTGALDATYSSGGFARFDAPWSGYVTSTMAGIDDAGRVYANVYSYSETRERIGVARLLAGDQPAPVAAATLRVDDRPCGATLARACFDPDGAATLTGQVTTEGRGVGGASVIVSAARPSSASDEDLEPELPAVRTRADGRFSVRVPRGSLLPGTWQATVRVIATAESQRVEPTRPVYFTLGPRADIELLRLVRRSQALAVAIDYIVDDSIVYGRGYRPIRQCSTPAACFSASARLRALISTTAHPRPGRAGLIVRKPGSYTVATRVPTSRFRLEFVITETPDDMVFSCRGDAAARKRWCPDGTWDDIFDDAFVTAGIDGEPFGW